MTKRQWHSCQPVDLLALARIWFVDDKRIELQRLATELGISRATAYRWAGSAEQLVGEVLCSLAEDTLRALAARTQGVGSTRVLDILDRAMHVAYHFAPLRSYLKRNPQQGLKLVASKDGPVQARTIELVTELLQQEVDQGHMQLPVAPSTMAYALTRVIESFIYADILSGQPEDLGSAREILGLLLQVKSSAQSAIRSS